MPKKPKQRKSTRFRRPLEMQKLIEGLRRSNAAQPHVPRSKKGTRTERKHRAIRDQQKD